MEDLQGGEKQETDSVSSSLLLDLCQDFVSRFVIHICQGVELRRLEEALMRTDGVVVGAYNDVK